MVINNTPAALECLQFVWDTRWHGHSGQPPLLSHHHVPLWESNWLLDWLYDHPGSWAKLHQKWNWMRGNFEHVPESEALIRGYHGGPHDRRWAHFTEDYAAVYGDKQ